MTHDDHAEPYADARRFAGVTVPVPDYAHDDGAADPTLAAALSAYAEGRLARRSLVAALASARLMTPLLAVLDEVEVGDDGLRREKSSHLATVSVVTPDGRRGLLAFTSVSAMREWDPAARGVPAPAATVAAAALAEGCDAVVLDPGGPTRLAVTGAGLVALATGEPVPEPWDDPEVLAAVARAVGRVPGVARLGVAPPDGPDSTDLVVVLDPAGHGVDEAGVTEVAGRLVEHLLADPAVVDACPRGIAVALGAAEPL
jgi:hypothetical protein